MKKVISATLLFVLMCALLMGCDQPDNPGIQTTGPVLTQPPCDHYDMDVDDLCDECGESLMRETEPVPTQTEPDYGTVKMCLYVEYTLGAYSSGTTTMVLYDNNMAVVDSVVDTSAVGQGLQHISETGFWQYDAESDSYTVTFGQTQYILEKNADGLFSTQYSFTMKGQTGGHQDISVVPVETN